MNLFRSTTAYRTIVSDRRSGTLSQAMLAVFSDEVYLRALLKECAKAFFGAADGAREERLISSERYPDSLFFPAEGGKLTADDCAAILEESLLRPVEGEKKLFVLDRFHLAAPLVQNKLLKLLEEPPQGVYFLLGAAQEYPVLPTVLSRVKKFVLPPFSEEQIAQALREKYPGEETEEAAAASGGIFSVGENLLRGGGEEFRLAQEFLSLEGTEAFCRSMAEHREKREFFAALKSVLRDALMVSAGQGQYAHRTRQVEKIAADFPPGALISALGLVGEAEKQIQFNASFASCLYTLALGIKEEKKKWQRLS